MMKKVYDLLNLTLLLLMGLLLYSSYPRLPERVPAHFDFSGRPDRWTGRGGLAALFVLPLVLTLVFYIAIKFVPRLGRYPRRLNIPHKEEFLRLPAEKQAVYWSLLQEFFAGLMAAVNGLFYVILRGTVQIAAGESSLLPFTAMLPAFIVMLGLIVIYLRRMFVLPGKLIRGEE